MGEYYETLAIAIVRAAVADYRKELKRSKKEGYKTGEAKAIERFFLSEYGDLLTFGKGKVIMKQIQKECGFGN